MEDLDVMGGVRRTFFSLLIGNTVREREGRRSGSLKRT